MVIDSRELQDAYASCLALAQSHYENFPVASRLLPKRLRPHVAAVYAFARTADDFADEPGREPDERLRLLKDWRSRLHNRDDRAAEFLALHDTIERFQLPVQLFDDLLDAFAQDVTTSQYETWSEVLDYCRRSANPVGRLVLRLSGYRDDGLDRASDAVCSALQLTNFWQDLAIDWSRGRLYVPTEIWRRHGAEPHRLSSGVMSPEWARALRECADRTRALFNSGRIVCDDVSGRLRYELRATWLGGTRILARLERSGFDVFSNRPALGAADAIVIACGTLLWRETRPSPTRS
ncbi:MAG: squalene synthase HpnC [Vicinamibacterales bacterium]